MAQEYSREEWSRMREENTEKIRQAVGALEDRLDSEDFQKIWLAVKEARELFRLKPLDREEQPELWERFQKLCQALEEIQNENIAEVESALSDLKSEHPLSYLNEMSIDMNRLMAFDKILGADPGRMDFGAIWAAASEVGNLMHSKTLMPPAERQRLRGELNAYRDKLSEIQDLHRRRHEDDCNDNYKEIEGDLNALQNLVGERGFNDQKHETVEKLKSLRPLRREEKDNLWQRFKNLCRADTEAQIERLEARLTSQESFLEKKEDQRRDLQEKLADARPGSDYEDRVQGWLTECEEKIDEVEDSIQKLRDRIGQLKNRI